MITEVRHHSNIQSIQTLDDYSYCKIRKKKKDKPNMNQIPNSFVNINEPDCKFQWINSYSISRIVVIKLRKQHKFF